MIRFRMSKISIGQFAILTDTPRMEGLTYSVGVGFSDDPKSRRVACGFSIEFSHGEEMVLKLESTCEFDMHPDDWNNSIKEGRITIHKQDLGYYATQTVGAARGILFCKTDGTPFNQLIIPPINLTELIKEDLVIECE